MNRVRLSDIARSCGVSVSTVGKVLNPSSGANTRVSEKTAEQIRLIAKELHYCPNYSAQNLRLGHGNLIGIQIDSSLIGGLSRLLVAIEQECQRRGYGVLISETHDDIDGIMTGYNQFRQHGAAGVICISHDYLEIGEQVYSLMADKPELVFIGRPRLKDAVFVDTCDEEMPFLAVTHLWNTGHRRIGLLISNAPYTVLNDWRKGFEKTIVAVGGAMDVNGKIFNVSSRGGSPHDIHNIVLQGLEIGLLDWGCDAIITLTDEYAGYLLLHMRERGIRVPEDISIISHGNDRFVEMLTPNLTTLDGDLAGQGRAAVELLMRLLTSPDHQLPAGARTIAVHPHLVFRDSVRKRV